jgi:hypothetical protein
LSQWGWIEEILSAIPHVIVEGMAVNQFAPPRYTEHFDIAVGADEISAVVDALKQAGFEAVGALTIGGYSMRSPKGEVVDVLLLSEEWANEAVQNPYYVDAFPVLDLPYLVLLKMRASRGVDIGDMQRMLHGAIEEDRERIRAVFQKYDPNDLEDLEQLIILSDHAW